MIPEYTRLIHEALEDERIEAEHGFKCGDKVVVIYNGMQGTVEKVLGDMITVSFRIGWSTVLDLRHPDDLRRRP